MNTLLVNLVLKTPLNGKLSHMNTVSEVAQINYSTAHPKFIFYLKLTKPKFLCKRRRLR